jgi:PAS domain-containing protein
MNHSPPRTEFTVLRQVFDILNDAVVIADPGGCIRYADGAASTLVEYPHSELPGLSLEMLIPERFRVTRAKYRQAFADTGQPRVMGRTKTVSSASRSSKCTSARLRGVAARPGAAIENWLRWKDKAAGIVA